MPEDAVDVLARVESRLTWRSLTVAGHEWRWLDTMSIGPIAILLPGSLGDAGVFARILEDVGRDARLIAVTYPALSDATDLATGLTELLEHLAVEKAVLVGSSFAAWWIQTFALMHPDRVSALVIGNGFIDGGDLAGNPLFERSRIEASCAADLHRAWLERVEQQPASPLKQLQLLMLQSRQSPENLKARLLGVINARPCPPLSIPADRITVLDCDDDPLISAPVRKRVREHYAGARHIGLTTGGHYPHLLNPQGYARVLRRSLGLPDT